VINDPRRPDPRKELCEELAELLAPGEGLRSARLLHLLGVLGPADDPGAGSGDPTATAETPAEEPRPIGIWSPRRVDGELVFERPEPHPLGDHHAARRRFRAQKAAGVFRIAFFGESAAAGYLLAPHLTPAIALEERLRRSGTGGYEVIDLARTNETLGPLAEKVEAARQLAPDLLVIFAGNNWALLETPELSPYFPSTAGRQRFALALRRGLGGGVRLAERRLRERVAATFQRIADAAGDVPVVLVVPEVDLADWEVRQPVPWLPGDRTPRWWRLYERAVGELDAGRHRQLLDAADALLELDGGACPTGHLLRGRALAALGDVDGARQARRAAVDATAGTTLGVLGSPQTTTLARELLRAAAERHGFARVELPELFARHTGGELPGARLFLDYCHLTREGVEVTASAVAAEVLRRRGRDADPRELLAAHPGVELAPAAEATALFGAALHGAHRMLPVGDKHRHLERWLRRALDADPAVADAYLDLADARTAPAPAVLTAAQTRNLAGPHRLLLQHGWRWDDLDADLLLAIDAVLEERSHPRRGELQRLLERRAVGPEPIDLTRPPYRWEPLERLYPEAMEPENNGRAFLRSPWPTTGFCLILGDDASTAEGAELIVEVTARLPAIEGWPEERTGELTVEVAGTPDEVAGTPDEVAGTVEVGTVEVAGTVELGTVPLEERWSRRQLRLPRRRLPAGLHRLTLRWPPLPPAGDAARAGALRRLEAGIEADLHPIFGELFALRVRVGK